MKHNSMKVQLAMRNILSLNKKFHNKNLISESFYSQLAQVGLIYDQCILIWIAEDGGNTYIGQIIGQNGNVIEFDVDLDSFEYSSWKDVTKNFHEFYRQSVGQKPWLPEVIAFDMFRALGCKEKGP